MSYQADIWRRIRGRPHGISIHALAGDTGASLASTRHYVYALLDAGVLEVSGVQPDHARRFSLAHDCGPVPPRHDGNVLITQPTQRYRIWNAMRVLRQFSYSHLVATAECEQRPARRLCADLQRAGYVRQVQMAASRSRREARYQLLRDTGPLPLVRHKSGALTDPNTNEAFE